jgi:threonylcarbamoyladenosine tRNA methylthiotransferase MtaB
MNRLYSPEEALECIALLRSAKDDPFLGCDIITGFPGESSREFDQTFEFCQKAGFAGIHAFPFSRRPGTEAWDFRDRVTEKDAGIRVGRLIELAQMQRQDYAGRWVGREVEAVAEGTDGLAEQTGDSLNNYTPALSENYLKLRIVNKNGRKLRAGASFRCLILGKPGMENKNLISRWFDAEADIII